VHGWKREEQQWQQSPESLVISSDKTPWVLRGNAIDLFSFERPIAGLWFAVPPFD
jgi:hypothetical protein